MELKHNICIENKVIEHNLKRLLNQIYKLLPTREEDQDWETPLSTIIEEIAGMSKLFIDHHELFFQLLCKLEGLHDYQEAKDFMLFRRSIFEILRLMSRLEETCQAQTI